MRKLIQVLLVILATVLAVIWQLRQCRKPRGARILRAMNVGHASLTDWGLGHVSIGPANVILDIGCGGGRTVNQLATRAPRGKVWGVDYSAASVKASRHLNANAIAADHVHIELASVAALPFADATFDLVTAVETHYYWPDLESNFREVRRVLKPGGTFALIAETVRDPQRNPLHIAVIMRLLGAARLTSGEHEALLTRAGFSKITTDIRENSWICVTAQRSPRAVENM